MFTRSKLIAVFSIVCMQLTYATHATEPLEVVLSKPSSFPERESGQILVTITNRTDRTLLLPRLKTPLFNPDDHLMGNFMDVRGEDGRAAKFRGRWVNIPLSAKRGFYAEIGPGESLRSEINLARDYDLSAGGKVKVSYIQDYGDVTLYDSDRYAPLRSRSNDLEIFVSPALIAPALPSSPAEFIPAQNQCDAVQNLSISWAL